MLQQNKEKFLQALNDYGMSQQVIAEIKSYVVRNDFAGLLKADCMVEMRKFVVYYAAKNGATIPAEYSGIEEEVREKIVQPAQSEPDELVVSKDTFEEDVRKMDNGKKVEQRIIAGTGCGKTTDFPFRFSKMFSTQVLVIVPSSLMAHSVGRYVKGALRKPAEVQDNVGYVPRSAVVYVSAPVFLMTFRKDPLSYDDFGVLVLDEAHENSSVYTVTKTIIDIHFNSKRVYHTSATFESFDSNHTRDTFKITTVEFDKVEIGSVEFSTDHPLHRSKVKGRCLMILPDMDHVHVYDEYYRRNGILTSVISYNTTFNQFLALGDKLREFSGRTIMVFADSCVQYGVTLPIERVYDLGYETTFKINVAERTFTKIYRERTSAEMDQIKGRVGRTFTGLHYVARIDPSEPGTVDRYTGFYTVCWFTLFDIQPNYTYDRCVEILGYLDKKRAWNLLQMPFHPVIGSYYLIDGCLPQNLVSAMSLLSRGSKFITTASDIKPAEDWFSGEVEFYGGQALWSAPFKYVGYNPMSLHILLHKSMSEASSSRLSLAPVRSLHGDTRIVVPNDTPTSANFTLSKFDVAIQNAITKNDQIFSDQVNKLQKVISDVGNDSKNMATSYADAINNLNAVVSRIGRDQVVIANVSDTPPRPNMVRNNVSQNRSQPPIRLNNARGRNGVSRHIDLTNSLPVGDPRAIRSNSFDDTQVGDQAVVIKMGRVYYHRRSCLKDSVMKGYILASTKHLVSDYSRPSNSEKDLIRSLLAGFPPNKATVDTDVLLAAFVRRWNGTYLSLKPKSTIGKPYTHSSGPKSNRRLARMQIMAEMFDYFSSQGYHVYVLLLTP